MVLPPGLVATRQAPLCVRGSSVPARPGPRRRHRGRNHVEKRVNRMDRGVGGRRRARGRGARGPRGRPGPSRRRRSRASRCSERAPAVQIRSSKMTCSMSSRSACATRYCAIAQPRALVGRARPAGRRRRSPGPRSAPSPSCGRSRPRRARTRRAAGRRTPRRRSRRTASARGGQPGVVEPARAGPSASSSTTQLNAARRVAGQRRGQRPARRPRGRRTPRGSRSAAPSARPR